MRLLLLEVIIVLAVSAAPQGEVNVGDAEFIPADVPRGSSSPGSSRPFPPGDFDVHFINIPARRPSIFDILFGTRPVDQDGGSNVPDVVITPAEIPDEERTPVDDGIHLFPTFLTRIFNGGVFPSVFSRIPEPDFSAFPDYPDIPDVFDFPSFGDIPSGFDNSTHEVKIVNGTRVEVNRTITKDGNGGFIFTKVILSRTPTAGGESPNNDGGSGVTVAPEAKPGNTSSPSTSATQSGAESSTKPAINETLVEVDPSVNQVEPYEDFS